MNINLSTINFEGGAGGGGGYVLPVASSSVLGGVKIGSGLTIDSAGVLSSNGGGGGSSEFQVQLSSALSDDWTAEDISALTEMAEYLSGATGVPAASIVADGGKYMLTFLTESEAKFTRASAYNYEAVEDTSGEMGAIYSESFSLYKEDVTLSHFESYVNGYQIVDRLDEIPNGPFEGQMVQVRTEEVEEPYYKLYYTGNVGDNDYWGSIINSEDSEWGERAIYLGDDGLKFYWDWGDTNPRDWAAGEWNGATYEYRVVIDENDYTNNEFHIKFPEGSPLELTNFADSSFRGTATGIATETVYKYGSPYIFENGSWIPVYKVYLKSEIQAFADSAQTAEAVNEMVLMAQAGRAPMVYDDTNNTMMALDSYSAGEYITFESDREGTTRFISLSSVKHNEEDYDSRGIKVWDNGWRSNPEYLRKRFYVDSAGTLSSDELYIVGYDEDFTRILLMNCPDGTGEGGDNTNLSHLEFRSVYQTLNGNDEARNYYVIGGKIAVNVDGTLHSAPEIWEGVWGMMQDEWTPTTLSWTKLGGPYVDTNHPVYVPSASE